MFVGREVSGREGGTLSALFPPAPLPIRGNPEGRLQLPAADLRHPDPGDALREHAAGEAHGPPLHDPRAAHRGHRVLLRGDDADRLLLRGLAPAPRAQVAHAHLDAHLDLPPDALHGRRAHLPDLLGHREDGQEGQEERLSRFVVVFRECKVVVILRTVRVGSC